MKKENTENLQKQVKKLSLIWVISYVAIGIACNARMIYTQLKSDGLSGTLLDIYRYVVMAICAFYFIPLAHYINRRAKEAEMKKIAIVSKALVIFMTIWLVMLLLFTLLLAVFPDIAG